MLKAEEETNIYRLKIRNFMAEKKKAKASIRKAEKYERLRDELVSMNYNVSRTFI